MSKQIEHPDYSWIFPSLVEYYVVGRACPLLSVFCDSYRPFRHLCSLKQYLITHTVVNVNPLSNTITEISLYCNYIGYLTNSLD